MSLTVLGWLVVAGLLAYCFWRILTRLGLPAWAAFLVFLPFVGQMLLVVWLAFTRWPAVDDRDVHD